MRAEWGHHVFWSTHCAACGAQVDYGGGSDFRLCDVCEQRSAVGLDLIDAAT